VKKYTCAVCGYTYDPQKGDPERGAEADTAFEDLPPAWVCPVCQADVTLFEREDKRRARR
jgi:rubredoxin